MVKTHEARTAGGRCGDEGEEACNGRRAVDQSGGTEGIYPGLIILWRVSVVDLRQSITSSCGVTPAEAREHG